MGLPSLSHVVNAALKNGRKAAQDVANEIGRVDKNAGHIAHAVVDHLTGHPDIGHTGLSKIAKSDRLKAGPYRPAQKGCGFGDMNPQAPGRRPYQFMMIVSIAAGGLITKSTFSNDVSLGEFVSPNACGMITIANQFPSFFASETAYLTISCGADAAGASEVDARLDAIEIVEKHDNQEVARYPLRTLHPRVSRILSDGTGSALNVQQPEGAGVVFEQAWLPQRQFSIYAASQAPNWNVSASSAMVMCFSLVGSIGAPNNC